MIGGAARPQAMSGLWSRVHLLCDMTASAPHCKQPYRDGPDARHHPSGRSEHVSPQMRCHAMLCSTRQPWLPRPVSFTFADTDKGAAESKMRGCARVCEGSEMRSWAQWRQSWPWHGSEGERESMFAGAKVSKDVPSHARHAHPSPTSTLHPPYPLVPTTLPPPQPPALLSATAATFRLQWVKPAAFLAQLHQ